MTTATPTLEERFTERTLAYMADEKFPDELDAGLQYTSDGIIGEWSVWEKDAMGDRLADYWMDPFGQHLRAIGLQAFREYVVPAMATAAAEYLRQNPPPAHLVAHEDSDALRRDLAILEAGR